MRKFDYTKLSTMSWDSETLDFISFISQENGKQEIYIKQKPKEFEKLVEIAKVQSTESSNAIEGIRTTHTRLRQIMVEKTTPKNRKEEEIAGYRDVLNLIHESFDMIPITPSYIMQLHKILLSHTPLPYGGKFKSSQNYISGTDREGNSFTLFTPLDPWETPIAMQEACDSLSLCLGNRLVHPLLLIPVFIHDFLCIHPFTDGNGRMSRLLTTLLLYRCGFPIGKYISLETKIAKNKDRYYDALSASQKNWHEGGDDPLPFIKYLLGIIASAYHDLEDRVEIISEKVPAKEKVRKAIDQKIGLFTKSDIREFCPSLSLSTVESALRELVAEGYIRRTGIGKSTKYARNS